MMLENMCNVKEILLKTLFLLSHDFVLVCINCANFGLHYGIFKHACLCIWSYSILNL